MEKSKKSSFWAVDFYLLPLKIHFFIFDAALGCALPFRTVFAKQLGVSATAVGIIFLCVPFMKIITNPLFGFILDYFKRFRLTLCSVMVCVALSHVALVFIPPVKHSAVKTANLTSSFRTTIEYNCPGNASPIVIAPLAEFYNHLEDLKCDKFREFAYTVQCDFRKVTFPGRTEDERKHFKCVSDCSNKNQSVVFQMSFAPNANAIFKDEFVTESADWENEEIARNSYENNSSSISRTVTDFHTTDVVNASDYMIMQNSTFQWQEIDKRHSEMPFYSGFHTVSFHNVTELCLNCPWNDHLECQADMIPSDLASCRSTSLDNSLKDDSDNFFSLQFCTLFILMVISSVSFAAVLFLMDAVCYEMLDPHKEKYGAQRLWATVGWGLGTLVAGFLNQTVSEGSQEVDYAPSFYLLAALTILDLIPVSRVELTNVKYSPNICKDVGSLLCRLQFVIYISMVLGVGVLSGLIWNYQFWFLDEIGASQTLLGLSNTFECLVAELPCFIISGWVITKIGHVNCLSLTFVCFGLKYLCFAYMENPWWCLPAGLFHGPTFGIFFASITMYGKTEAPLGTEASVQAFLSLVFEGIGVGMGSMFGGIGFDAVGSRRTFIYAATASFALLVLNVILQLLMKMRQKRAPVLHINGVKTSPG